MTLRQWLNPLIRPFRWRARRRARLYRQKYSKGWSVNQIRALEGLPPIEWLEPDAVMKAQEALAQELARQVYEAEAFPSLAEKPSGFLAQGKKAKRG